MSVASSASNSCRFISVSTCAWKSADFQAQVLTLMNRQEFDAELATDTSSFLHEFICNSLGIMDPKHR